MSTAVRRSSSAAVPERLNVPRIAAISATLAVHLLAFGFLMVPVSLPEPVGSAPTVTEVVFTEPEKPKPIVLRPLPPEPVTPLTAAPVRPLSTPPVKTESAEAGSAEPLPGDAYVPEQAPPRIDGLVNPAGGEVDASTRSRYPIRYPPEAIRAAASGVVWVLARFDAAGTVTETRIHKSSRNRDLDRAALTGVRQWKINPPQVQGQPVGGEALVEVAFNL